jgi:hypothetical protein
MKKPKNQFAALSQADQNYILDLCARQIYDDIVELLRKPRAEGGLDIITSRAALCRFFTTSREESNVAVLAQVAAAANIRHEQNSNAFLGAIRATVEARVLENLRNGRALADMEKDFRFLKTVENLYLADARWRTGSPKSARPAYQAMVDRYAGAPDIDFVPVLEANADLNSDAPLNFRSEFDRDLNKSRERQKIEAEQRARLLASIDAARAKSPVIPHIPPNSTNASTASTPPRACAVVRPQTVPANVAQPAPSEPKKPVPYVSPTPKVGRNDPCPCGSGRKSKKCCHK